MKKIGEQGKKYFLPLCVRLAQHAYEMQQPPLTNWWSTRSHSEAINDYIIHHWQLLIVNLYNDPLFGNLSDCLVYRLLNWPFNRSSQEVACTIFWATVCWFEQMVDQVMVQNKSSVDIQDPVCAYVWWKIRTSQIFSPLQNKLLRTLRYKRYAPK